jgi:hypothetical protein
VGETYEVRLKYAGEMRSGVMIYIPSCIMIDSGIQELIGPGLMDTQATCRCLKPTLGN